MPQQTSPFTETKWGWNYGEAGWNSGMDENLLKMGFMFDGNVDSIVSSLPAAVNGNSYFLTTDNRFYFAVGSTFYSSPCPKHFVFKIKSSGDYYEFNGTSAVQIDNPSQVGGRLDSLEATIASLGSAAFEDVADLATQTELDVASAQANDYTDTLRSDLTNTADPAKGAGMVGWKRSALAAAISSVGAAISALTPSVWEAQFVILITSKPNPADPSTWDWTPAFQSAAAGGSFRAPGVPFEYKLTDTVVVSPNAQVFGDGMHSTVINWQGGDKPVFASQAYGNINNAGSDRAWIRDLRIRDHAASRASNYTIDLANGQSCKVQRVKIKAEIDGTALSGKYGVFMGTAEGSTYSSATFVATIDECRLERCSVTILTTDYYIRNSEIWGNGRDFAIRIGAGGTIIGNQLVGGATYGAIYLSNPLGYDIDTLRVIGNYFDGSNVAGVDSGHGIYQEVGALVNATIVGNNFWWQNKSAITVTRLYHCCVVGNMFDDCDAADQGFDDIRTTFGMFGTKLSNTHKRKTTAPKTGATRVNKGRPLNLIGNANAAISTVSGCTAAFGSSVYNSCSYAQPQQFKVSGSDPLFVINYTSDPTPANLDGEVYKRSGRPFFSDGARATKLDNDAPVFTGDMNALVTSQSVYVSNAGSVTNLPGGVIAPILVDVKYVATNYATQVAIEMLNGKVHCRYLNNGTWTSWVTNGVA